MARNLDSRIRGNDRKGLFVSFVIHSIIRFSNLMAKISTKNVAGAIYASAKDKSGAELNTALKMAVEFLAKKNLLSEAPQILQDMEQISDTEQGILRARVLSRKPLTKKATDEVESLLTNRYKSKSHVLEWKENKSLIGGVRIETKDEVIDMSLKNKLNQLQNHLLTT